MHGPTRIFWANLTHFSLQHQLAAKAQEVARLQEHCSTVESEAERALAEQADQYDLDSAELEQLQADANAAVDANAAAEAAKVGEGESVIKCPSPLNVLKYTYDHSCY